MQQNQTSDLVPPRWVGRIRRIKSRLCLSNSRPLLAGDVDNMANIDLLQRQWPVEWPEFQLGTQKGQPDPKRCFQMFAPYISRLGYTDTGRVYSIICPQQGVASENGLHECRSYRYRQRGWVNETTREMAAV